MLTTTLTITRQGRHLIRDSQAVHRTLLHATGGDKHLWGTPDPQHLVVRHPTPVDWLTSLPGVAAQAVTTPTAPHIAGEPIRFAIIANPTRAQPVKGKRGKVRALPPEKWTAWLDRKLGDALNLHTIESTAMPTATGKKDAMRTVHRRVLFTGTATVKTPETLHTLMREGIGRGKAYGCGLLLTERITT